VKTRQSQATIYEYGRTTPHCVDSCPAGSGEIAPQYRGFQLHCLAAELPAKQRAIDRFWSDAYFKAQTEAGRRAVIAQEREWRDAPREWT
jgi:hypothetical protein